MSGVLSRVRELTESAADYLDNLDDPTSADDHAGTARILAERRMAEMVREQERAGNERLSASAQREFDALTKLRSDAVDIEKRATAASRAQVDALRSAAQESRDAATRSAEKYGGTKMTVGRVNEPDLYRQGGEHGFFRDLVNARHSPLAAERLLRHEQHAASQAENRAISSGDFAGLIVPQYLVSDYAPIARAGRPFADQWFHPRFPAEGMTLNVPRGNTGTLVSSQTTENTAVAEQDHTVADIVVPVVTIAGQVNPSRQSIDRGVISDEVLMMDLAAAYAAELDRQIAHGTGGSNEHFGILSTTGIGTITMTSTNAVIQMRTIGRSVAEIATDRKLPPTLVVMHPRRWAYWGQATDSDNRPLIGPSDVGRNVLATREDTPMDGIVGRIQGMPVLVDANLETTLSFDVTAGATTDPIIVTRQDDLFLYEDAPMPRRVRFEETLAGQLTVKIVAWDYSGATSARYTTATMVLAGSGLTTPTWAQ